MDELEREIDRNFDAFQVNMPSYLERHRGEYALLRDAQVVDFLQTPALAEAEGHRRFADGRFSIQQVDDSPADLGFFSYAFA